MSTSNTPYAVAQDFVPSELVNTFIEMVGSREVEGNRPMAVEIPAQAQDGESRIRWLRTTMEGICRLPWQDEDLPDGRKPAEATAAARLLWLLWEVLEEDTIPPTSIIPTWRGGTTAEWHVNGFDLEIESDPSGAVEYNFAGPDINEYEGPVDKDLGNLKRHVRFLPREREQP